MSSNIIPVDVSVSVSASNATRSPASTIRSRSHPHRMVSLADYEADDPVRTVSKSATAISPDQAVRASSAASTPTPTPHPPRSVSSSSAGRTYQTTEYWQNGTTVRLNGPRDGRTRGDAIEPPRSAADLFDASWSSLQSLASSVLGSDITRPTGNGSVKLHARKPSRPDYVKGSPRGMARSKWGTPGPFAPETLPGSREERYALVQAKRREVLLLADTDSAAGRTRHKRRDSSDQSGHSGADPEEDEGALAYVHHVQPGDTMTGVTIKYGCQPAVIRRANGFWPSDSIQSRKTVLLPVESCSVKGRPLGRGVDPLKESRETANEQEDPMGKSMPLPEDGLWKHESWVQIDGFTAPVEIGRVPRGALGFFPRTRRKSTCYTDEPGGRGGLSPSLLSSTESASTSPSRPSGSAGRRGPTPRRHQRQRSVLELSAPGVGTLDPKTMTPGPALDVLSKFLAQHFPTLAPETQAPSFESTTTAPATASTPSTGLDNIGGVVEGWVRKMTTRAKNSINELHSSGHTLGRGAQAYGRWTGDLIELDDARSSPDMTGIPTAGVNQSIRNPSDVPWCREQLPSPGLVSGTRKTGVGYDWGKDD